MWGLYQWEVSGQWTVDGGLDTSRRTSVRLLDQRACNDAIGLLRLWSRYALLLDQQPRNDMGMEQPHPAGKRGCYFSYRAFMLLTLATPPGRSVATTVMLTEVAPAGTSLVVTYSQRPESCEVSFA